MIITKESRLTIRLTKKSEISRILLTQNNEIEAIDIPYYGMISVGKKIVISDTTYEIIAIKDNEDGNYTLTVYEHIFSK